MTSDHPPPFAMCSIRFDGSHTAPQPIRPNPRPHHARPTHSTPLFSLDSIPSIPFPSTPLYSLTSILSLPFPQFHSLRLPPFPHFHSLTSISSRPFPHVPSLTSLPSLPFPHFPSPSHTVPPTSARTHTPPPLVRAVPGGGLGGFGFAVHRRRKLGRCASLSTRTPHPLRHTPCHSQPPARPSLSVGRLRFTLVLEIFRARGRARELVARVFRRWGATPASERGSARGSRARGGGPSGRRHSAAHSFFESRLPLRRRSRGRRPFPRFRLLLVPFSVPLRRRSRGGRPVPRFRSPSSTLPHCAFDTASRGRHPFPRYPLPPSTLPTIPSQRR